MCWTKMIQKFQIHMRVKFHYTLLTKTHKVCSSLCTSSGDRNMKWVLIMDGINIQYIQKLIIRLIDYGINYKSNLLQKEGILNG